MAVDVKAQTVLDAANQVRAVAQRFRSLATGILEPVAGNVKPHPDTIAAIKAEFADTSEVGLKKAWETARDALDAAILV